MTRNPATLIFSRSICAVSTRRASAALAGSRSRNTSPAANCALKESRACAATAAQESRRRLDQETAAVAGLAVGGDRRRDA